MSKAEAFFDHEYGFSTDTATYTLSGHLGATDQAIRADIEEIVAAYNHFATLEAEVERLRARVRELEAALTDNAAHLAAAISLLERGGKAAKKAAASDKMFDIMLNDYRKSMERARAALAALPAPPEEADDSDSYDRQEAEVWASGHWDDES